MEKTMQLYIILNGLNGGVCFSGPKPFIGQLRAAQDQADFLKSINPSEEYVLAKVVMTDKKGTRKAKYADEGEKANSRKVRVKPASPRTLKDAFNEPVHP
jgi:hypothetical protein